MFLKIITFPLKLIVLIPIYFYKFIVSPILPDSCIYYPSCSNYAIMAIKKHGVFKGGWMGIKRICRCRPGKKGGYDPVPDSIKGDLKWLI